ncbi:hypothetical protein [Methylobacterium aquaticum]|jgi:hypothetical protein|uniref:hypothetical protein n=1 Tax=Methylobacterium aquaticum TaxID=270351 RepID=UPI0012E297DE|nr:hypothetical protein [Methylobacterium aquaticum]
MTAQLPVEPLSLSLGYEDDVIFAKPLFEWLTNSDSSIVEFCFALGGSQQEASSMDTSEKRQTAAAILAKPGFAYFE